MLKPGFCIKLFLAFLLFAGATELTAQNVNRIVLKDYERNRERKVLHIPDLPGFLTLKGDFHMHTMFSDGSVWPETRVDEAWKEGVDVIAITDHLEYLPHKKDITADHNRSWKIAQQHAKGKDVIVIAGTEIT